jgi:secondary thiamine-phosphate synthase enzyme
MPSARTTKLTIQTRGAKDVVDLTGELSRLVESAKIEEGTVHLFAVGSTCALTTLENEDGLLQDFQKVLDRLVPPTDDYAHAQTGGDDNAPSHIWASLIGPSLTIPVVGGRLALGTWQQAVLVELDFRPRRREVVVQLVPFP